MGRGVGNPAVSGKRGFASWWSAALRKLRRSPAMELVNPSAPAPTGWTYDARWSQIMGRGVWRNFDTGQTALE